MPDPRLKRTSEFSTLANGWTLCSQRLVRLKYEACRPLATMPQHHEELRRMLQHYLDETSRNLREKEALGHDVSRLTAILAEGMKDRYEGPLVYDRYRIYGALAPAGSFYIADYNHPELCSSGSEEVFRFTTLKAAQRSLEALVKLHEQGKYPVDLPKPRLNLAPTGRYQPSLADSASAAEPPKAAAAVKETKKAATPAKTAAAAPAQKEKKPSASAMFCELIMEGKLTDDQIFAAVQIEFKLDESKRSYVKWYRNDLKKKGKNPPAPVGESAVAIPNEAGIGKLLDLAPAPKPRKGSSTGALTAVVEKARKEVKAEISAAAKKADAEVKKPAKTKGTRSAT